MERLYPNRAALMEIYKESPMLAVHLSAVNTSTPVGQKIAEGLPWLFTETEINVVILERILYAPEYGGEYVGNYVEELMNSLNLPWMEFISGPYDKPKRPRDRFWPDSLPRDAKPGLTFEYEGVKLVVVHNIEEYLEAVPANMLLYRCPMDESLIPAGRVVDDRVFEIGKSGKLRVTEIAIKRFRAMTGQLTPEETEE